MTALDGLNALTLTQEPAAGNAPVVPNQTIDRLNTLPVNGQQRPPGAAINPTQEANILQEMGIATPPSQWNPDRVSPNPLPTGD